MNGTKDDKSESLPMLAQSELTIGSAVGQGGFSLVCKVDKIELEEVYDTSELGAKLRSDFAASLQENHYVLKTLRPDLPEEEYIKGIVDLAIEAEFLSVLSHPNIISMRAMANSDPYESRFFVVLDRLVTTLDRKFNQWRKDVGDNTGYWFGPFGYCCSKPHFLYVTWLERLTAAKDIARAIEYLHHQQICYRDLKPDNLGFDANGTLKLFDFGLAKRMDPTDKIENGLYLLTGNTGSLRYMAPEVARGDPYDQRVDTYSFGILFWQICSLQTPFAGMTTKSHAEHVVRKGQRPTPDKSWPLIWVDIMSRCWDSDMTQRPDFEEIASFLMQQIEDMENNDGEVPNRTTDIKAQKRVKPVATQRLDVDTRISTVDDDAPNVKQFEQEVV
ncbi:serine/threonine protein kinase [Nitzschia inconspicua]|uniref:Serine/threonine protein kinase n=1 Tax=Nitzschia inconspicua TaxID=303405 RepID=A0A9K3LQE1_9STRA|nr:serine/threonine protein kinase [Nitzschia inconspicua]